LSYISSFRKMALPSLVEDLNTPLLQLAPDPVAATLVENVLPPIPLEQLLGAVVGYVEEETLLPAETQDGDNGKRKGTEPATQLNRNTEAVFPDAEERPSKFQRIGPVNTGTTNRVVLNKEGWASKDYGNVIGIGWAQDNTTGVTNGEWIWTGPNEPRTRDLAKLIDTRSGTFRIIRDEPLPTVIQPTI
jgi:hypothetical protein